MVNGTKLARIKSEAENILMFESDLDESPTGLPSVSSLDMGWLKMDVGGGQIQGNNDPAELRLSMPNNF